MISGIEEVAKKRLLMIASSINRRRLLIMLHIHPNSDPILHPRIKLIPQPIPRKPDRRQLEVCA